MPVDAIHPDDYLRDESPHRRIRWTPHSNELHLNLVHLRAGEEIGEHVNAALDVVLTCLDGSGTLVVDGDNIPMMQGSIALIARGSARGVIAGPGGMRYTTCHTRRGGLIPSPSRQ
jgi:quercetin dioxygenase-like cupin family protein